MNKETDIATRNSADHQIQFTSGRTIYVEALLGDRWVGRYWSANGRSNWAYELWEQDAFQLEIEHAILSTGWRWISWAEGAVTNRGARHFVVEISNTVRPVGVRIHTQLDGTPVLTRWLEITNNGGEPLALTQVYPWSSLLKAHAGHRHFPPGGLGNAFNLGFFSESNWGYEGWFNWKPLSTGSTIVECSKGQGFDDPFFIVNNRAKGEFLIGHLAWPANWRMEFNCQENVNPDYERRWGPLRSSAQDLLKFQLGPSADAPQRIIAPGETIETPAVHLGLVSGDLDAAVQAMHSHLRHYVLPSVSPESTNRIQFLVPGDQGYLERGGYAFDENTAAEVNDPNQLIFDEAAVRECIDIAESIGAELFTLDAGWWDEQGDWFPSPSRFPRGLEPLVEYAHQKGLRFGMYGEIERAYGKGCKVVKEHPDWIGPSGILNLTRPEVAEYVESELVRLIEGYELDLFRLDYNPLFTYEGPTTHRDGFVENNYWRYYSAFYTIFDRIRKRYPNLILQQCAVGGARNDLGVVSRFHEAYLTDVLWLPHVLQNYSGLTMGMPPEIIVTAFGACREGIGYPENFDTLLRCIFTLGTPLIFAGLVGPSRQALTRERRNDFLRYAKLYREFIRPLLPTSKLYHHAPVSAHGGVTSSGWFAVEFASPDRSNAWATFARIGTCESDTYYFVPKGLHRGKTYTVTFDSTGESVTADGLRLVQDGIPIRLESIAASELLVFVEQ